MQTALTALSCKRPIKIYKRFSKQQQVKSERTLIDFARLKCYLGFTVFEKISLSLCKAFSTKVRVIKVQGSRRGVPDHQLKTDTQKIFKIKEKMAN